VGLVLGGARRAEKNRDLCIAVPQWCVEHDLSNEILRKRPPWLHQREVLQRDWIDSRRPTTIQKAWRLLRETGDEVERQLISYAAGRRGPPIKLRKPAIQARILREYHPRMKWKEITERVRACSEGQTREGLQEIHEGSLKRTVRQLKRLLVACDITLPPEPTICVFGRVVGLKETGNGCNSKVGENYWFRRISPSRGCWVRRRSSGKERGGRGRLSRGGEKSARFQNSDDRTYSAAAGICRILPLGPANELLGTPRVVPLLRVLHQAPTLYPRRRCG